MNQQTFFDVDPEYTPPSGESLKQSDPCPLSIDGPAVSTQGAAGVHVEERGGVQCQTGQGKPARASAWTPVPFALFASWSPAMQLAYCARRDRDSAAQAYDPEWAERFLARAAAYDGEASHVHVP